MKKLPFFTCGLEPRNLDREICYQYGKEAFEKGMKEGNEKIIGYAELFLSIGMELGSDECRDYLKDNGFF